MFTVVLYHERFWLVLSDNLTVSYLKKRQPLSSTKEVCLGTFRIAFRYFQGIVDNLHLIEYIYYME